MQINHSVLGRCLSVQDAAARLKTYDQAIYRLLTTGGLIGLRDNGRWLVSSDSVEQYLARQNGDIPELWLSRAWLADMDPAVAFRLFKESSIGALPNLDDTRQALHETRKLHQSLLPQQVSNGGAIIPYHASMGARVVDSATSTTGGPFKFTQGGTFADLLRNKASVTRAGARLVPGLTGPVSVPKQNATATAAWVAENPGSDSSLTNLTASVVSLALKTLRAGTGVTNQALVAAATNYDLELIIREDLAAVIALAIDLGALNGSGSSNQPLGVLQDTSVGTSALGANGGPLTGSHAASLIQSVADNGGDASAPSAAFVTNEAVARYGRSNVRGTNINVPLIGDDDRLAGRPAFFSNQIPRNLTKGTSTTVCSAIIFGVWEHLIIGMFGAGFETIVDPYAKKLQGVTEIVVNAYCDIVNTQPGAFQKTVDVTTP
jgi:HK97 family phage major capsid protein